MKRSLLALGLVLCLQTVASAQDFYDIIQSLNIQRPNATTQTLQARLYRTSVDLLLLDRDGNNTNFSNRDFIQRLVLSSRGGTLSFPGGNRDALEQFARANADAILKILFPDSIAAETLGQPENQLNASLVFGEVIAPLERPKALRKADERIFRSELSGRFEYTRLRLNEAEGDAFGALLGYKLNVTRRFQAGLLVPYRYTKLQDNIASGTHFVQIDAFTKYTLYDDGTTALKLGGDAFTSILVSQSDAIKVLGNIRYGGGVFAALDRELPFVHATLGVGYKLSEITIPSSFIKGDYDYIVRALTNRDTDKDLIYGINLAVPLTDQAIVNVNAHRINSFSKDIPRLSREWVGPIANSAVGCALWDRYTFSDTNESTTCH